MSHIAAIEVIGNHIKELQRQEDFLIKKRATDFLTTYDKQVLENLEYRIANLNKSVAALEHLNSVENGKSKEIR